jgi:hypothetical protein
MQLLGPCGRVVGPVALASRRRRLNDLRLTALTAQPPGVEIAGMTAYYFHRILNHLARYEGQFVADIVGVPVDWPCGQSLGRIGC